MKKHLGKIIVLALLAAVWYSALTSQSEPNPDALRGGKYSEVCGKPNPPLFCGEGR